MRGPQTRPARRGAQEGGLLGCRSLRPRSGALSPDSESGPLPAEARTPRCSARGEECNRPCELAASTLCCRGPAPARGPDGKHSGSRCVRSAPNTMAGRLAGRDPGPPAPAPGLNANLLAPPSGRPQSRCSGEHVFPPPATPGCRLVGREPDAGRGELAARSTGRRDGPPRPGGSLRGPSSPPRPGFAGCPLATEQARRRLGGWTPLPVATFANKVLLARGHACFLSVSVHLRASRAALNRHGRAGPASPTRGPRYRREAPPPLPRTPRCRGDQSHTRREAGRLPRAWTRPREVLAVTVKPGGKDGGHLVPGRGSSGKPPPPTRPHTGSAGADPRSGSGGGPVTPVWASARTLPWGP